MMNENRKVSRRKEPDDPSMNPHHAADYLADVLPALANIADRAGLGDLAFILEMAMIEAAHKRHDYRARAKAEPER